MHVLIHYIICKILKLHNNISSKKYYIISPPLNNSKRVTDVKTVISRDDFIDGRVVVLRSGKRKYCVVEMMD